MSNNAASYEYGWEPANPHPYGWGIVSTAKHCLHRKGSFCKAPFPKGEKCCRENCIMLPQDLADMFPEDYQELRDKLDIAEARCKELEAERDAAKQAERDCDSACNTIVHAVCDERDMWEQQVKGTKAQCESLEAVRDAAAAALRCADTCEGPHPVSQMEIADVWDRLRTALAKAEA